MIALATVNLACALGILLLSRLTGRADAVAPKTAPSAAISRMRLTATLFFAGLLGIGYEVVCVNVLGQAFENTVYSFASALSVYLVGTSLGAVVYQANAWWRRPRETLCWLSIAISAACLFGVRFLGWAKPIYELSRRQFGAGAGGSIAAELLVAGLVFLPPTIGMGALFSHLAQLFRTARGGVGAALAWNTVGACLAPLLFAILLYPVAGSKWTLVLIALAYLAFIGRDVPGYVKPVVGVLFLVGLMPVTLIRIDALAGSRVLDVREGVHGTVAVIEGPDEHRTLKVNNRFSMGGTESAFAERRQAHIPLLMHPDPRRALFLGVGTGITFDAAADHPSLRATGVELVPEIVDNLDYFNVRLDRDELRIATADARRYVSADSGHYDVIIADLFHPARDGAGSLYTVEHFRAIRQRMAPGGVCCQWIPSYQMDEATLRVILRSWSEVFAEWSLYLAHFNIETPAIGLVAGAPDVNGLDAEWFAARTHDPELATELDRVGVSSALDLQGCWVADKAHLDLFVGSGDLNTDDHPVVTYSAPGFVYRKNAASHTNLFLILENSRDALADVESQSLRSYIEARNVFLTAEVSWWNGEPVTAARELLQSVRTCPDFGPAFALLLVRVPELAEEDIDEAVRILEELNDVRTHPAVRQMLRQLQIRRRREVRDR